MDTTQLIKEMERFIDNGIPVRRETLIIWRNFLEQQSQELPSINAKFETFDGFITGYMLVPVKRIEKEDDDSYTVVIDYWPKRIKEMTSQLQELSNRGIPKNIETELKEYLNDSLAYCRDFPDEADPQMDHVLAEMAYDVMELRLEASRNVKGRWWDENLCSIGYLKDLLSKNVEEGDMVDTMNIAAMIYVRELMVKE